MRSIHKAAVAMVAACALAMPTVVLADALNPDAFVTMCDADKDGMVSKAEMVKMVEKVFDKHDAKKMGKLDKKQAEAFLKELMRGGGGG